jgi:uncharacterized protein YceH (UPF0502 family)
MVRKLPRLPGQKEQRYMHLFGGEPDLEALAEGSVSPAAAPNRVDKLESDLLALRSEFEELKQRFDQLEAQLR